MTTSDNGTTKMFAAINVLDGTSRTTLHGRTGIIPEFIRFLNAVERAVPKPEKSRSRHRRQLCRPQTAPTSSNGFADRPRWTFQFHPDLGLVAQCRRGLLLGHHTRRQIRRGQPIPSTICRTRSHFLQRPQQRLSALHMDHFRQSDLRKTRSDPCIFCLSQCTSAGKPGSSTSAIGGCFRSNIGCQRTVRPFADIAMM